METCIKHFKPLAGLSFYTAARQLNINIVVGHSETHGKFPLSVNVCVTSILHSGKKFGFHTYTYPQHLNDLLARCSGIQCLYIHFWRMLQATAMRFSIIYSVLYFKTVKQPVAHTFIWFFYWNLKHINEKENNFSSCFVLELLSIFQYFCT